MKNFIAVAFGRCVMLIALAMLAGATGNAFAQSPELKRATGDQQRQYVFAPTGQQLPYRIYVPKSWDGKSALPIVLFLHGAGANERTYLDMANGQLQTLAEKQGQTR